MPMVGEGWELNGVKDILLEAVLSELLSSIATALGGHATVLAS